jgi:glutathione S-transferase
MALTLYDFHDSGNGYKVRLLLSHLGTAYRYEEVDILKGQSRTSEFLAKNPNGRIPVLELEDGTFLAESNAILYYLAEGTRYLPEETLGRAQVLQWMFFEQYSHEPNVATVRFWRKHLDLDDDRRRRAEEKTTLGHAALAVMERHLAGRTFFVDERYTIADISLYAYTHVADEGGFDLSPYVAVRAWLERVREQPGYVPLYPS